MTYLAYFILLFTFVRLLIVLSNAGQRLRNRHTAEKPLISVLIPARNEEHNIGNLLGDLVRMKYENLEIIVYDDHSEDGTAAIVQAFSQQDARIKMVRGEILPAGWKGKNHACHQLALRARGAYFLFLDADVRAGKTLPESALATMERYQTDLLSIFPHQIMETIAEKVAVPLMNWILVSLLPLPLVRLTGIPSLAAANGQFMMFRAEVYHREMFHSQLRGRHVEDIVIARFMKKKGYRVQTLLGNREISCRMYRHWEEALNGFSRNTPEFFGGSSLVAVLFALMTTLGIIPVAMVFPFTVTVIYLAMILLIRIMVSAWSLQSIGTNLLLAPLQQLTFLYIVFLSLWQQKRRSLRWKGRLIYQ
jgi:glycosyltransferase involved in cell wall biosynthesis